MKILRNIGWALFGNDEDGYYGWFPHKWYWAVVWWLRNPFHNLFFHVLNWPGGPFFQYGDSRGFNAYIGFRPKKNGAFGISIRWESKDKPS